MALTASGQAYRLLIEFCPTFDGVDAARLAELAVARGHEGVTAELATAAITDLQEKLRLESFARGVGGEIGTCVLNSVHSQLADKEICYLILGQSGESHHPLQVKMVRDRAAKLG